MLVASRRRRMALLRKLIEDHARLRTPQRKLLGVQPPGQRTQISLKQIRSSTSDIPQRGSNGVTQLMKRGYSGPRLTWIGPEWIRREMWTSSGEPGSGRWVTARQWETCHRGRRLAASSGAASAGDGWSSKPAALGDSTMSPHKGRRSAAGHRARYVDEIGRAHV